MPALDSSTSDDESRRTLSILVVTPDVPFPPLTGHKTRVLQLCRQLAREHRVVIAGYADPAAAQGADSVGDGIDVFTVEPPTGGVSRRRFVQATSLMSAVPFAVRVTCGKELQALVDRVLAGRRFDCSVLEASTLGGLRLPAGLPVVVDQHNIEWELLDRMRDGERSSLRRLFARREAKRFRRFEEALWRSVDACAVTSAREIPAVSPFLREESFGVVPNAVDLETFRPGDVAVEPDTAVFTGTLHYRPNVDAAIHLVDEIWPRVLAERPGARLTIVGSATPPMRKRLERPGVLATGEVEDVRPYLARAAVAVVPVRMGGGTRFKVLEGLAMAKPMVSTSLGCEGIDVEDGRHLLVADTAEDFADAVLKLFRDPLLASSFAGAARQLLEERYGWEAAGAEMARLVRRAVVGRPGAR
jgi:glycosyltransferase involved in cell wall biosynthesis